MIQISHILTSPVPLIAVRHGDHVGLILNPNLYASTPTWVRDTVWNAALAAVSLLDARVPDRSTEVIDLDAARELRQARIAVESSLLRYAEVRPV